MLVNERRIRRNTTVVDSLRIRIVYHRDRLRKNTVIYREKKALIYCLRIRKRYTIVYGIRNVRLGYIQEKSFDKMQTLLKSSNPIDGI